jgi:hypothetical protein
VFLGVAFYFLLSFWCGFCYLIHYEMVTLLLRVWTDLFLLELFVIEEKYINEFDVEFLWLLVLRMF